MKSVGPFNSNHLTFRLVKKGGEKGKRIKFFVRNRERKKKRGGETLLENGEF